MDPLTGYWVSEWLASSSAAATYHEVKDTEAEHFKPNADVTMMIKPVQHTHTQTTPTQTHRHRLTLCSQHSTLEYQHVASDYYFHVINVVWK